MTKQECADIDSCLVVTGTISREMQLPTRTLTGLRWIREGNANFKDHIKEMRRHSEGTFSAMWGADGSPASRTATICNPT